HRIRKRTRAGSRPRNRTGSTAWPIRVARAVSCSWKTRWRTSNARRASTTTRAIIRYSSPKWSGPRRDTDGRSCTIGAGTRSWSGNGGAARDACSTAIGPTVSRPGPRPSRTSALHSDMLLTPLRSRRAEILDDPAVDPGARIRSIGDVVASNRWLGGRRAALGELRRALRGLSHATVLDIGTGLADIPACARERTRAAVPYRECRYRHVLAATASLRRSRSRGAAARDASRCAARRDRQRLAAELDRCVRLLARVVSDALPSHHAARWGRLRASRVHGGRASPTHRRCHRVHGGRAPATRLSSHGPVAAAGGMSTPYALGPMPADRRMTTIDERLVAAPLQVVFALAADVE